MSIRRPISAARIAREMRPLLRILAASAFAAASAAFAALPTAVDGQPLPSLAPMLEKVTPAVVNIAALSRSQEANPLLRDPFFRRFFKGPDQPQRRERSAGSGVIVDAARGYVLTNHHVIKEAQEIVVTLKDRRGLKARARRHRSGHRHRGAAHPGREPDRDPVRRFRRGERRRLRGRDRQSVRHRPDGHLRHRQRARPQRARRRRLRGLHPDRRLDQPGQLGRRAGQPRAAS